METVGLHVVLTFLAILMKYLSLKVKKMTWKWQIQAFFLVIQSFWVLSTLKLFHKGVSVYIIQIFTYNSLVCMIISKLILFLFWPFSCSLVLDISFRQIKIYHSPYCFNSIRKRKYVCLYAFRDMQRGVYTCIHGQQRSVQATKRKL